MRVQAGANSEKQLVESPDLSDAVIQAVLSSSDAHAQMMEKFFANPEFKHKLLGTLVHDDVNRAG